MSRDAESLQDLIKRLSEAPSTATLLVSGLSDEETRVRNTPEEFSALENVCHLRDIEVEGYEKRIVRILQESNPTLPDIDGAALAIERNYNSQNLKRALQDFTDARNRNIETLKRLSLDQFSREGVLEGVGPVSIARLLELMREHDEGHLSELRIIHDRSRSASVI